MFMLPSMCSNIIMAPAAASTGARSQRTALPSQWFRQRGRDDTQTQGKERGDLASVGEKKLGGCEQSQTGNKTQTKAKRKERDAARGSFLSIQDKRAAAELHKEREREREKERERERQTGGWG